MFHTVMTVEIYDSVVDRYIVTGCKLGHRNSDYVAMKRLVMQRYFWRFNLATVYGLTHIVFKQGSSTYFMVTLIPHATYKEL